MCCSSLWRRGWRTVASPRISLLGLREHPLERPYVRPFVVVVFRTALRDTALRCVLPRPPARLTQSLAAAVFCDPPTSPLCFVWGGASPAESCVRRAPLCFLLLPTIISFPSYQRRLLPPGLVFSACGNTLGRPGGAAAGASMAR